MKTISPHFVQRYPLWAFFILTYALNLAITFTQLYILRIPQTQFVAILQVLTPTVSAVMISSLIGGKEAVIQLLSGFTRWKVSARWYLAAFMMTGFPLLIAMVYIFESVR